VDPVEPTPADLVTALANAVLYRKPVTRVASSRWRRQSRLLRDSGLVVEDLLEVQPGSNDPAGFD